MPSSHTPNALPNWKWLVPTRHFQEKYNIFNIVACCRIFSVDSVLLWLFGKIFFITVTKLGKRNTKQWTKERSNSLRGWGKSRFSSLASTDARRNPIYTTNLKTKVKMVDRETSIYRKNLNNWTVCHKVQNSLLWKGGRKRSKTASSFPFRDRKKMRYFFILLREESPTTWNTIQLFKFLRYS